MNKKMSDDDQTYTIIGLVFTVAGILFFFSDTFRAVAFPFLIMGITFLTIGNATKLFRKK